MLGLREGLLMSPQFIKISKSLWVLFFLLGLACGQAQSVRFNREFAALEGYVKPAEQPWRAEVCLNGSWQFQPVAIPRGYQRNQGVPPELPPPGAVWETTPIRIPSPWNANTYGCGRDVGAGTKHPYWPDSVWFPSYPKSWDGVQMGWLRRQFAVPNDWQDKRILLHFEAVAGGCRVLVNGRPAGEHFDNFLPFDLDITALVNRTGDNELCVGIRHPHLFDETNAIYPHERATYADGSYLDGIVGIWQDVYLLGVPPVRVVDDFVHPWVNRGELLVETTLRNDTARPRLAYFSASELAWFGLEHLPLGCHDFTRLPNPGDGIVFPPLAEGRPGVQPERIPPYCTTLNPGYDPALPVYVPLAMFAAMKAALAPGAPQPSPWDHAWVTAPPASIPAATITLVGFAGDRAGPLFASLTNLAAPLTADVDEASVGLLVIDGETLSAPAADALKPRVDALMARGGQVLICFHRPAADVGPVNRLLPAPIQLTPREATALDRGAEPSWSASFSLAELYFAENDQDRRILKCGLDGDFVRQGTVVFKASNTDWSLFNNVSEVAKCAAVVLYEHLAKPPGAALVTLKQGRGAISVSAIEYASDDRAYVKLWGGLLRTMGVQLGRAARVEDHGEKHEHNLLLNGPQN